MHLIFQGVDDLCMLEGCAMENQPNPVSELFFGRDDAENDLTAGLLSGMVFQHTYAYRQALSGRTPLIIGRKGAGKSAICRRLASPHGHSGTAVLITPDDAAGDEIRRFELQGVSSDTAKSLIWRYVFAIHAARYLCGHARAAHGWRSRTSVRALRNFLETNDETGDERLYERLRRGILGLQTANLSLKAFGIEAGLGLSGASEGARASRQLEILEKGVAAAFTELGCSQAHTLLFLVDQIEQVWTIDPDSHALVTGLLLASKEVTRRYGNSVRCTIFLRSDIYDTLVFSDADKFHSDELRITWSREELDELVLARAAASLKMELTREQLWGHVFPSTVLGEPTGEYLFQRSLPRPRDTIQFLNLCQQVADKRGHRRITEDDMLTATGQFSRWKLTDLAREYSISHPFLAQLFLIFENNGYVVMLPALVSRFEPHRDRLQQDFADYAESLTAQGILDVLFGIGFLGVKRGRGVVYSDGGQVTLQPGESEFHVHPCFRSALGAVDPADLTPYNPSPIRNLYAGNTLIQAATGSDISFSISRNARLLDDIVRACERLLRQLMRAALPEDMRAEVQTRISHVMDDARRRREDQRDASQSDVTTHVLGASDFLGNLAVQLGEHGFREEPITRRLDDEARALIRSAGGAVGGGSGSASPP
ncbi:P-loop ATPase, Sll1717 family [Streptomyces sp. NPDC060235]|uniref:P-loop ATPase, Sll1717 family n=1 Tax=Streptomyces sp. NPDC060235 TaxID=3347080 RepID=UPI00365AA7C2